MSKFGVLGHSSCFQICYCREDKVQWSEPNCPTDGHKIPKKWHCRGNKRNKNHVNGSECKTDEVFSPRNIAISFVAIGQKSFFKVGICWPAIYLEGSNLVQRGIRVIREKTYFTNEWKDSSEKKLKLQKVGLMRKFKIMYLNLFSGIFCIHNLNLCKADIGCHSAVMYNEGQNV